MRRKLATLALITAALLTVSGCVSAGDVAANADASVATDGPESTSPTTSDDPTVTVPTDPPETTATKTEPPHTDPELAPRPSVGDCFATGKAAFQHQSDGSFSVPCSTAHTAETFAVFQATPVPNSSELAKIWRTCNARFKKFTGDSPTVSTLSLTVILPSVKQIAAGAEWVRCDALESPNYNGQGGVTRTGSLKNALKGGDVPNEYRGCVKHWPRVTQKVHFTSCAQRHQAELIPVSIGLGGANAKFPGTGIVESRSKTFCGEVFQDYVPETTHYYYYYPTRDSWSSGTHETACWALDTQGDGLPPAF